MIWLLVAYAALVVGLLLWSGVIAMRFKGTLRDSPLPENLPHVSTVVPARNEERNIGRCAQGLTRQTYPNLELIFVDDDSSDATPDILAAVAKRDSRVKLVHTEGKPADWNGKHWACWSGAMAASGDWLCFMDADTYAEPDLITRTVSFAEAEKIDMLTLQPWYEMQGMWERIALPAGLVPLLLFFPPDRVNNPDDKLAVANGQFILIRRSVYDAVDGHRGIRQRMMDDFALAESVKHAGNRLYMAEGMDVMRVRLYRNLREIRAGALKAAVEITGGWLSTLIGLIANFAVNTLPLLLLIWAVLAQNSTATAILGAVVLLQLIYYALIRTVAFRAPPWSSITYPFGSLIASGILVEGMLRLASGAEIKWKGRDLLGRPDLNVKRGSGK